VTAARIATDDVPAALAGIDATWRELSPDVAISRRFMDELFDQAYARFLSIHRAVGGLAVMALFIATAGLVGIATLAVARRRAEIGVRKTFGASTPAIVAMLLRAFTRPVLIASIASWPIAWIGARAYLGAFVDPIPLTAAPFAGSLVLTLLVAWIAILGQTLRAARTAPAQILHQS
jgi:putative ABC transport system permease protein